jgi:hypothetical protein
MIKCILLLFKINGNLIQSFYIYATRIIWESIQILIDETIDIIILHYKCTVLHVYNLIDLTKIFFMLFFS